MRSLPPLLLTAALSACIPDGGAPVATAAAPIIGGTAAPGDSAVVLFAAYPTDRSVLATCSAVLIAPDVVATAAHCVDQANHPGWLFGVYLGADATAYPTLVALEPHLLAVTAVHPHPSYVSTPPFTADVAVAILAQPVTGVAPVGLWRAPITPDMVGDPVRIVGYGQAVLGTPSATRRQAATVLAAIDSGDTIKVGDAQHVTCLGDSGGPALYDGGAGEVVLGLDSYADGSNCDQPAHFRRADLYLPFFDTYDGYVPPGPDAGVPGPDAGDPPKMGGGGCAAGGEGGLGLALVIGLAAGARRRARVTRRRARVTRR
jgi:hypothetical protein